MSVPTHWWLSESVDDTVKRAVDRMSRLEDVAHLAVMPDVHLAGDLCVGTATATRRLIYPALVGGDIGCGMLALAFDVEADALRDASIAGSILRRFKERIPQRRRHHRHLLPWPDDLRLNGLSCRFRLADDAALQLGTLGGGNHFVELQSDEAEQLWLMLHSGSRAVGQAVRNHHVANALESVAQTFLSVSDVYSRSISSGAARTQARLPVPLNAESAAGQAYLNDAAWASRYASANRGAIAPCVVNVLREVVGARPIESSKIEGDHNHVRHESHDGERLYIHRKGAMAAHDRVAGMLPGSMGTRSYHVEGRGCAASLRSSAHGAGRRFSRPIASERFTNADVKHQLGDVWYDPRQLSALREEMPHAYKDVRAVLRAQEELVRVTRTLRPVLAFKGR